MATLIILVILLTALTYAGFFVGRTTTSTSIVNARALVLITFYMNLVFPATLSILFNGGQLTWASSFSNVESIRTGLIYVLGGLIAFISAYWLFSNLQLSPTRSEEHEITYGARNSPEDPTAYAFLSLAIALGLALKIAAIAQIGFGPQLIERMSGNSRAIDQMASGSSLTGYLALFSTIADAAAAVLVVNAMKHRSRIIPTSVLFIVLLAITYILISKRSAIILTMIAVVVGFHKYTKKLTVKNLPFAMGGVLSFGLISLLIRILAPHRAAGRVVDLREIGYSKGSIVDFYLYSPEFAGFDMVVRAIYQSKTIIDSLGGEFNAFYRANIEPFTFIIPRALWENKPFYYVDIAHGFYVTTFGGGIDAYTPGFAATLIGYCTVLGGPLLVLTGMFTFGIFVAVVDARFSSEKSGSVYTYSAFMLTAFFIFRQGSVGWVFLTFVQNMLPILVTWGLFGFLSRNTRRRDNGAIPQ
jgi:hypothetical protein